MDITNFNRYFYTFFKGFGASEILSVWLNLLANSLIVLLLTLLLSSLLTKFLNGFLKRVSEKTTNTFDDYLYHNKLSSHFAQLLTLYFVRWMLPVVLVDFEFWLETATKLVNVLTVVLIILLIRSILLTFKDFLRTLTSFKDKPIESYIQVFMIFLWFFGLIFIFSLLTGRSVWTFLTAMGALSAVVLLIFKDTILGFVASIQISVNDTVRIGDWITMDKYGADGDVVEINLSSVKVRNFDKTITTIPTYYLISDSFKNWRGMSVSGGRRIKRAILLKTASIHFLTAEEIKKLREIDLLNDYLDQRTEEIDAYNQQHNINKEILINGRNLTNIGVFRTYVDEYLKNHPGLNKDMIVMSRQLQPTPQGIPLEIYAFSQDKVWLNYEGIIGDIFDHLLAAVPYFNLEVYELPTGNNFNFLQQQERTTDKK